MAIGDATREWSFAIFNNRAFAAVAVSAHRICMASGEGLATVRQVAAALGFSDSTVKPIMVRLAKAGLLEAQERETLGSTPAPYLIKQPDHWEALLAFIAQALGVLAEDLQ